MRILILLTIIICTVLNGQSILHFGLGIGEYGGATATPYDNPTSDYAGMSLDLEYELSLYNLQSVSFLSKYSYYDKSDKEPNESNSNAFNLGVSYNITNTFTSTGFIIQVSPILSYEYENVEWKEEYPSSIFYGMIDVEGTDIIEYISYGFIGGFGIRTGKIITKLNVSYIKDRIIHHERTTSTKDYVDYVKLEYKTTPHSQIRLSVGYFL